MTTPLHTQAQQLETALRDASRATNNPAYAALAILVQTVAERLKEIEPEPRYRMLEAGEIIRKGDDYQASSQSPWKPFTCVIGEALDEGSVGRARRPLIPADEFQALTEFHQREVQK